MKVSELIKELKAAGCYVVRQGGNHEIWYSPITGMKSPVSRHTSQELPSGTEKSIRKILGINK